MSRRPQPPRDTLINLGLAIIAAIIALAAILRVAGTATAALTNRPGPDAALARSFAVLAHPDQPGMVLGAPHLNPILYWVIVIAMATACATIATLVWRLATTDHQDTATAARRPGTASRREVSRHASGKTLRRRAGTLRPSLHKPRPTDVGYWLGTSHGRGVWATVEDSILLIGPPRSGKGLHIVINAILDAPGPVVTTSTRPDNLTATLTARQQRGPVAVFDPQHLASGLPAGLRWSPVRGCDDPLTAMIRATGLASGTGLSGGGVDNGSFWEGKTRTAIQALLHAAALDGRDAHHLYQWALNPTAAADAVRILHTHSRAADGWADSLDAMINADPRTRDSIWQGVSLAFAALADPRVLDTLTPSPNEAFDPKAFLTENGTLYLLGTAAGAGASASLVAAFIEDLVETARQRAATLAGARLDPPLLLALDEIGNRPPLPSLPALVAEGGGTGITCMPVLQSLAQARHNWGAHAATAIWDASIVKIILGGASDPADLRDLSALIGDYDDPTDATTVDHHGGLSTQRSLRRMPIMPPDQLRTLPFGTGIVLLRATRPIVTTLRPWTKRADADNLRQHRNEIEQSLREQRR